jgi:CRP/FNR family transcriptional regulator
LLSGNRFPAEGITDTSTEVIALTSVEFEQALHTSSQFRSFVFSNVGQRLADVITRIEQLCSHAIDHQLAKLLLALYTRESELISTTHQELASELGTAREVVSRHLKQFELHGWVQLGRGTILIKEYDILTGLSKK